MNEQTSSISDQTPHAEILAQLCAREPIFHRREWGTSRADFEEMTVANFFEIGASGRLYSREHVLNTLEERHSRPHAEVWEATDFHCRRLAPDLYLLTYKLLQDKTRLTRRSTIWQKTSDGWKIVFHQGTIMQHS